MWEVQPIVRNAFVAPKTEMNLTTCETELGHRFYLVMGRWGGGEGFASTGGELEVKPCMSVCFLPHADSSTQSAQLSFTLPCSKAFHHLTF